MNKRAVGTKYERLAGEYLEACGYKILQYNFSCKFGEIDIIAQDGEYLVFVEVKYRKNNEKGMPQEAVNWKKQKKISRAACYYCVVHGYGQTTPCRFDVVSVIFGEINVIKDAFDYCGF